jgi:hypothetical protein
MVSLFFGNTWIYWESYNTRGNYEKEARQVTETLGTIPLPRPEVLPGARAARLRASI